MLGSIAAIKGALEAIRAFELDHKTRIDLLDMALVRVDLLAAEARDIALGLPGEALEFLTELRREPP
jgi:hypothetical protein